LPHGSWTRIIDGSGRRIGNEAHDTTLDILPTICDYAGVPIPKHLLGASLRPVAEGRSGGKWREYVASENGTTRMIRSRDFKYCLFLRTKEESLVDMKNDPGEMRNVAGDRAFKEVLAEHRRMLAEWNELSGDRSVAQHVKR
jgi:arylsulfatase A-like enzyme